MDSGTMDMEAYAELKAILGDTLKEVILMYLETMPEMLDALNAQIQNKDANQVFEIAHRIKSSSSSIGAMGVANAAEIIEQTGREGSTEMTSTHLEELKQRYDDTTPFLSHEIRASQTD